MYGAFGTLLTSPLLMKSYTFIKSWIYRVISLTCIIDCEIDDSLWPPSKHRIAPRNSTINAIERSHGAIWQIMYQVKCLEKKLAPSLHLDYLKICQFDLRGWESLCYTARNFFNKSQRNLWSPFWFEWLKAHFLSKQIKLSISWGDFFQCRCVNFNLKLISLQ